MNREACIDQQKVALTGRRARGPLLMALAAMCVMLPVTVMAQSPTRVYRCDNPDGTPLYQNAPGKGCRLLDLPPVNSVPAERMPVAPRARQGSVKVDEARQRSRDSDRRHILEDELAREQRRLDALRSQFNNGEPVRRDDERDYPKYLERVERLKQEVEQAEANVASLQREIGALR